MRRMLTHFDRRRHIVRSFSARQPDGSTVVHYELAHDYLAGVIRNVAGAELSGTRRSQAILHSARMQAEYVRSLRLTLGECWYVYRYPPDEMTAEDRRLVRRSIGVSALQIGLPLVGLGLVVGTLRFGTMHFELERDEIVVKRGLPYLQPLLGSREVYASSSLSTTSAVLHSPVGNSLLDSIRAGNVWTIHAPTLLGSRYSWDKYLFAKVRQSLMGYLENAIQTSQIHNLPDADVEAFVDVFDDDRAVIGTYERILLQQFEQHREACNRSPQGSFCTQTRGVLRRLANVLWRHREPARFFESFERQIDFANIDSWNSLTAIDIAKHHSRDRIGRRIIQALRTASAQQSSGLVRALANLHELEEILSAEQRTRIAHKIFAGVKSSSSQHETEDAYAALVRLGLPNEAFIAQLFAELHAQSSQTRLRAFGHLIDLKVRAPQVDSYLTNVIAKGLERLSEVEVWRGANVMSHNEYEPEITEALNALDVLSESDVEMNNPAAGEKLLQLITTYVRKASNEFDMYVVNLVGAAVKLRMPVKTVLDAAMLSDLQYNWLTNQLFTTPNECRRCSTQALRESYEVKPLHPDVCKVFDLRKMLNQVGAWECHWGAVALICAASELTARDQFDNRQCASSEMFRTAYAQRFLIPKIPTDSAVEELLAQLESPRARRSSVFRYSVVTALVASAAKLVREPQGLDRVTQLNARLTARVHTDSTPAPLRLALAELKSQLAQVIDDATRPQRAAALRSVLEEDVE